MTKQERAVIEAAIALCKAGKGFCWKHGGIISSTKIGTRLEKAVAALAKARRRG